MIIIVIALSVIAYTFVLYAFRKKYLVKQILLLYIYLVGLTLVGELDYILPLYFLFSLIPFLKGFTKVSTATFLILCYFGLYLIFGILCQNAAASIGVFISKYWQFIVFFIITDSASKSKDDSSIGLLLTAFIIESVLGVYLIFNAASMGATTDLQTGLVRLVSNSQPITGNLAVSVLPISCYIYFKNNNDSIIQKRILLLSAGFLGWIILSGTRGYILMFAATMFLIFADYYIAHRKRSRNTAINRLLFSMTMIVLSLVLIFVIPDLIDKLGAVLRIKTSVGIRTYENAAIIEFFKNAPIFNELFGIGIGGTAGNYSAYVNALQRQFSLGMWHENHYLYDAGSPAHNFFANVLVQFGLVGIIIIIAMNIIIWKRITNTCGTNSIMRKVFHLYQISFLFMNYYRWSAACGIGEMIVFAMMLKIIKENSDIDNSDSIKIDSI